jgi:lipid-A-disaccharide synthase
VTEAQSKNNKNRDILIIAGEASGDTHGAKLIAELHKINSSLNFWGLGGDKMTSQGLKSLYPLKEFNVMGFVEIIRHLSKFRNLLKQIEKKIIAAPPRLCILIDYPGFNLKLAAIAKKHNIPIIYYISPQVWAWGIKRVYKIAKLVDEMLVILPFEKEFYAQYNIPVHFVGHPLIDYIDNFSKSSETVKTEIGLKKDDIIVGLLPGSRQQEIEKIFPIMLSAAKEIEKDEILRRRIRFITPEAETLKKGILKNLLNKHSAPADIHILDTKTYSVFEYLSICDLVLVASGTATLETACAGVPMIVTYKASPLTAFLARLLIKVKNIALVNIVAGKTIVPEYMQNKAKPFAIAQKALAILKNKTMREEIRKNLLKVKESLGPPGASKRAAEIIYKYLGNR